MKTGSNRWVIWLICLWQAGCGSRQVETGSGMGAERPAAGVSAAVAKEKTAGLQMTLRALSDDGAAMALPAASDATPLSAERRGTLLARSAPMPSDASAPQSFSFRQSSLPPPRAGRTVTASSLQSEAPPPSLEKPGELTILRVAPEGPTAIAPHLSVTFSKPMTTVTDAKTAAEKSPITISPLPEGKWRALGTRTMMFVPEKRFPMATEYKVEIPAGTQSVNGDTLKSTATFTFQTPPLQIERSYPDNAEPQGVMPAIFIAFNQRIDPEAVMKSLVLYSGKIAVPTVRVTQDALPEAQSDGTDVRALAAAALPDTWLAFRPASPLDRNRIIRVVLKKGAPSAEGPLKTKKAQEFGFRTYAPLEIVSQSCSRSDECPPDSDWTVELNNAVDMESFDPAAIVIDPPIANARVEAWYRTLRISGLKNGRTTYRVTLPASLKDSFGQTLEKALPLTFAVGQAQQNLFPFERDIVTLDPSDDAVLPVYSTNLDSLKVTVQRTVPSDYRMLQDAFQARNRRRNDNGAPIVLPGENVFDGSIPVTGPKDTLNRTLVDLRPYLKGGFGQFLIRVRPGTVGAVPHLDRDGELLWVQVTNLGLTAFVDNAEAVVWTTALSTGRTVGKTEVELLGKKGNVTSTADAAGLARLPLPLNGKPGDMLVAKNGADVVMLPYTESLEWGGGGWHKITTKDELRFFTFDDRGMYRPGETAHIKGWFRRLDGQNGALSLQNPLPKSIGWRLTDAAGNERAAGKTEVSLLCGFDFAVPLPEDMHLGDGFVSMTMERSGSLSGAEHYHNLKVQEFRRPEFEVTSSAEAGPFVIGNEAKVSVFAAYYAGGGLPFAPVTWTATATPAYYTPPGREDFQFGPWHPWWRFSMDRVDAIRQTLRGKTDGDGVHRLGILFESVDPPRPMSVSVEGQVTDVNQQAWSSRETLLVHPSNRYVGLRNERGFVGKNEVVNTEVIVTDIDGKALEGAKVQVTLSRIESTLVKNRREDTFADVGTCEIQSMKAPVACALQPPGPGVYRLLAETPDEKGRTNRTEVRIWVEGAELPKTDFIDMEQVVLVPEKESYQPGETASFMVQAPFYPAEGVLTVRKGDLVETRPFHIDAATVVLMVPVTEALVPDFGVQVDLTGGLQGGDGANPEVSRPAFASGALRFQVPPRLRTLQVGIAAKDNILAPGKKTVLNLTVLDGQGRPAAGAETAVVVVDESVLALTGYRLPDPMSIFYAARGDNVMTQYQRRQVQAAALSSRIEGGPLVVETALPTGMTMAPRTAPLPSPAASAFGVRDAAGGGRRMKNGKAAAPAIQARVNFDALALFAPSVRTDQEGRAQVEVTVPDSVTRYRIMAVAASGETDFGSGESSLVARLPLMVRPSPPRFLNVGDRFELPVVLQNQTAAPMTVSVAVRAAGATLEEPGNEAGVQVTVRQNDRVEVRFFARAERAGQAVFQIVAASGPYADAQTISLPVRTPAAAEAFATYGEIDDGAVHQPLQIPNAVWPEYGGIDITASSTELSALTDAVLYLVTYPFECAEQLSSRVLAVAALKDVLSAFAASGMPSAETLIASVEKDIRELEKIQNEDGGFGFWRRGEPSLPYLSVHAAHALAAAKEKGFKIPEGMWNSALEYVSSIRQRMPDWYDKDTVRFIAGYAVFVQGRMGQDSLPPALALLEEAGPEVLPLEAAAWILPGLHKGKQTKTVAKILKRFENSVAETAAGAHFVTSYTDGARVLLHSDRRADAVLLGALIEVSPKHDLIPKLVRGLLGHQTKGRWESTQENGFVLAALDRYFSVYEKTAPDFTARAWLGDKPALESLFKGRSTDRVTAAIPMAFAQATKADGITVAKDGKGRLYYRIGMRYAPKDLTLKPADEGFAVERIYEAVDDPKDVRQDKNGTWHIRRGARVRVRVSMAAPMRRYHTALVDPLPAGLEPINPSLAVEGAVPDDPKSPRNPYWWWTRPWFEHQNLRDDRAEAFASMLWEGVHEYTYTARATVPGTFGVPPARAEEMYAPETFGRSATDRVVVE